MAEPEAPPILLTPIDNVMPRHYVRKFLFFSESPGSDVTTMIHAFQNGLSKTLQAIVPLSGTIKATGQRGGLCVSSPWSSDGVFQVKDLRHEADLEYGQIRRKQFPLEALDREDLIPLASRTAGETRKVMLVQLNIVKGGIIVVLCLHHSFTDGLGTLAITRVWAAFCKGEDGSRLVTPEMLDRGPLMRGWGSASLDDSPVWTTLPERKQPPPSGILARVYSTVANVLSSHIRKYILTAEQAEGNAPVQHERAMFFFSKDKLVELKNVASAYVGDSDSWISTNDALCALLGCCAHSAMDEHERMVDGRTCSVSLVVGGRSIMKSSIPVDYIGNVMSFVSATMLSRTIAPTTSKVAELAHLIRAQIKQRDEPYIQRMIAALSSVNDISRVTRKPPLPSENRLVISSWANQGFYDLDWGDSIGARVESVRYCLTRNNFCVILPELSAPNFRDDERGLEVVLKLEKVQMERLKQDELFMSFAQHRCPDGQE